MDLRFDPGQGCRGAFDRDDVRFLRALAAWFHEETYGTPDDGTSILAETVELRELADRIDALLSPAVPPVLPPRQGPDSGAICR